MIPLRGENSSQPGPRRRRRQLPDVPSRFVVRQGDAERRANAIRALDRWIEDGDVEVTLSAYHPKHSDAQRALFYAWCEYIAKFLRDAGQPCSGEAVHDWILGTVYGWEDLGLGKRRPVRSLTAPRRMGKVELMEILTRLEAEASAEFGCMVPRPETWDRDVAEYEQARANGSETVS